MCGNARWPWEAGSQEVIGVSEKGQLQTKVSSTQSVGEATMKTSVPTPVLPRVALLPSKIQIRPGWPVHRCPRPRISLGPGKEQMVHSSWDNWKKDE